MVFRLATREVLFCSSFLFLFFFFYRSFGWAICYSRSNNQRATVFDAQVHAELYSSSLYSAYSFIAGTQAVYRTVAVDCGSNLLDKKLDGLSEPECAPIKH